jgi:zinc protease
LTVLVNERTGMPIVSANLVVKTGSEANPIDKPGLASFTAAMLDEGTATRSALAIADEVAQLGASLSSGSSPDASQVSGTSLRRTFPDLLTIMADVVRRPTFPADEIDRQRASRLASLLQQRENPSSVANTTMFAALYGPSHPFGFPELGTEASNKAMTGDDMKRFWTTNFVPNNAALIVSGQMKVDELKPLVERAFGEWARGTAAPPFQGQPGTTSARLVIVDKGAAPQTQLRVASIGLPRGTPDYEPAIVMNEALGGLFSSRINLNLREQHGYTYGASSQFVFRRSPGPFLVSTGVRTDVTGPAVSEIFKEVRRMRDSDLSPEELVLAKDSLIRSLPAQFETSSRVTSSTSNIFIFDLGLDYYAKLPDRLAAVTVETVRAVAQKYVVPENLIVVAVGDQEKVRGELQKLGLGQVEVRAPDGTVAAPVRATQ